MGVEDTRQALPGITVCANRRVKSTQAASSNTGCLSRRSEKSTAMSQNSSEKQTTDPKVIQFEGTILNNSSTMVRPGCFSAKRAEKTRPATVAASSATSANAGDLCVISTRSVGHIRGPEQKARLSAKEVTLDRNIQNKSSSNAPQCSTKPMKPSQIKLTRDVLTKMTAPKISHQSSTEHHIDNSSRSCITDQSDGLASLPKLFSRMSTSRAKISVERAYKTRLRKISTSASLHYSITVPNNRLAEPKNDLTLKRKPKHYKSRKKSGVRSTVSNETNTLEPQSFQHTDDLCPEDQAIFTDAENILRRNTYI